jgi:hypothetical protein
MAIERLTPKPFMSYAGKKLSSDSYTVRIEHGAWRVEGVSKNPLNFKLGAKYQDLFNGLVPGAELLYKTGSSSLGSGIFTQKYFAGGNNLDMNVEFRIYDDGTQDINPCIQGARNLANMTVTDALGVGGAVNALNRLAKGAYEEYKDLISQIAENGIGGLSQKAVDLLDKFSSAINKRAVTLTVMNLFRCRQMAIQDVSVTYSPSLTHTGPLFADFSISLLSLQAITRGSGAYGVDSILKSTKYNIMIDGAEADFIGPLRQGAIG